MTQQDLLALAPLLSLAAAIVLMLLALSVGRCHRLVGGIALGGLFGGMALSPLSLAARGPVMGLLNVDGAGTLFVWLILAGSFVAALLAMGQMRHDTRPREEFYVLLLLAALGAAVLALAVHFVSLVLGLELLTVSLYSLVAYRRERPGGVEAGVKYLLLGGTSGAFLLMGMALVYGQTGTMQLAALGPGLVELTPTAHALLLAGVAMMLVAIGFKLALAPFHMWTPDIYQGAADPVSALVATVSKAAALALLLRVIWLLDIGRAYPSMWWSLAAMAIASICVGNLLGLLQPNVRRMLAYSSIAHLGYVMVAMLAGPEGRSAVMYYLVAYFVSTIGAFGVLSVLASEGSEEGDLSSLEGLLWRRPVLGGLMTLMLLSLAGIPLTAGFVGKLLVLLAGIGDGQWGLALVLIAGSAVGLFYYLRVVAAMWRKSELPRERPVALPGSAAAALLICGAGVLALGVWPWPLMQMIDMYLLIR